MEKILLMTMMLICIPDLAWSAAMKKNVKFVDIGNGLKEKELYSEGGALLESLCFDKKTLKPHGERKWFGKNGEIIKSEWYVAGELSDQNTFIAIQEKHKMEIKFSRLEKQKGTKINTFVNLLSGAWARQDYEYCNNLIKNTLKEDLGWVPGHLAEFGYLAYVELDLKKAFILLDKEMRVITKETGVKDIKARRILITMIANYKSLIAKCIKKGSKKIDKLGYIFPGSELIVLYGQSKGYKVSSLGTLYSKLKKQQNVSIEQ